LYLNPRRLIAGSRIFVFQIQLTPHKIPQNSKSLYSMSTGTGISQLDNKKTGVKKSRPFNLCSQMTKS
jgi:hypothetical protein